MADIELLCPACRETRNLLRRFSTREFLLVNGLASRPHLRTCPIAQQKPVTFFGMKVETYHDPGEAVEP